MANGFVHKDLIKSLKENFVPYFNKQLEGDRSIKVSWDFPDTDLKHAVISGKGLDELKTINTIFKVSKNNGFITKDVMIDLVENYEGTLNIGVNGNIVCSIGSRGRISIDLLKSLAKSLIGEIYE